MTDNSGFIFELQGKRPHIDPTAWVAPGARVIGDVTLAADVSVWFNAVLRADFTSIRIGAGTNVQDLTMIHVDGTDERYDGSPAKGVTIGERVTIGHQCMIHSCDIADDCLVGMGATIMSGATIGQGSIVGAGAVVLEDAEIPPFSLVVGAPAKVRKTYEPSVIDEVIRRASDVYKQRLATFRGGLRPVPTE